MPAGQPVVIIMDPSLIRGSHAGGMGRYDGGQRRTGTTAAAARGLVPTFGRSAAQDEALMPALQSSALETTPGNGRSADERRQLLRALEKGSRPSQSRPQDPQVHMQSVGAMVAVPWVMFVIAIFATALMPPTALARIAAWLAVVLGIGFSLLLIQVYVHARAPIYKYLGILGIAATSLGGMAGSTIFDRETLQYWMAQSRISYKAVVPSQPAGGISDAATLEFVPGTRVDLRRSFGFRDPREGGGTTYCLAPVMDIASTETNEVRFWAVGTDCCEPSWGFRCGAARSPSARSGLVVRDVTSSAHASIVHSMFREGVDQASAMYQLSTPEEDPIFVRWCEDATVEVSQKLGIAIVSAFVLCLLYLALSVFLAGWLHWRTGQKRQDWQQAQPTLGSFAPRLA
mmetsp:Transcript_6356/g.15703  ORF Transcript_6356/g.15703 Transcript_6356/m.15703 type:complete len:401 (-) Transcript_6356:53-1255(-)